MLPAILHRARQAGHVVFTEGTLNVNLIAIRELDPISNRFGCLFTATYREPDGSWVSRGYPCTTNPGHYWLENPGRVEGTAILVPGQYRGAYELGEHRGKYRALVQRRPVNVWRDDNRDEVLDWGDGPGTPGYYGINVHRASAHGPVDDVDRWSAGCIVLQDPNHFQELISICYSSMAHWGKSFTLTLLAENQP